MQKPRESRAGQETSATAQARDSIGLNRVVIWGQGRRVGGRTGPREARSARGHTEGFEDGWWGASGKIHRSKKVRM